MTTNEAAERLHCEGCSGSVSVAATQSNAHECRGVRTERQVRRATVERIRERLNKTIGVPGLQATYLLQILDEELRSADAKAAR